MCNVHYRVRIMVLVYVYQVIIEGGGTDVDCQVLIVWARGHITLFFYIYNVLVVSCQLMCAESKSDVCQFVGVEHFFLWHEIQDGQQKI